MVKYANFKPNKKQKSKLKSGKKTNVEENEKNFKTLIDKILEFNETYKQRRNDRLIAKKNIKTRRKRKGDEQDDSEDFGSLKDGDADEDSENGSYHSVLEKNFIRSDGPYLIRLRKPPSKDIEASEQKGDGFNRDVQQATTMMVDLIGNNKGRPDQEQYEDENEEEVDYQEHQGEEFEQMRKGDIVVPQISYRNSIYPSSKDDHKYRYNQLPFANSNMETPRNNHGYVYSPILSKRAGAGFITGFMPFSPSNPNTTTAGKKCGFTINPTNPLVNPSHVSTKMDKTLEH